MRKRILAFVLTLAMLVPGLAVVSSAVPYSPPANNWKPFSQEHNYVYEVTKGNAAPKADGKITEADGYGEPIATYGFRYVTTADRYVSELDDGIVYKLKNNGEYYVYPTMDSPDEIWNSIASLETDSPFGHIMTYYNLATSFSSTSTYYYHNDVTTNFTRAYLVKKDTFSEYTALSSDGYFVLNNVVRLNAGAPVDWETNYMDYFTKIGGGYAHVEPTKDGTAPEFVAKKYYFGEKIVVDRLFTRSTGSSSSIGSLSKLKRDRVVLPEEVKLYARYDGNYLYYAVEVVEPDHKNVYYNLQSYYSTTMSNNPYVLLTNFDFANYYRRQITTGEALSSNYNSSVKTFFNASNTLKTESYPYILAKFGNPDTVKYNELHVANQDYCVLHDSNPAVGPDVDDYDVTSNGIRAELRSDTYGTTVYEYRLPWTVINGKYSPDVCDTPVPEVFAIDQRIQLDNNVGRDTHTFSLSIPRYAYSVPGSYSKADYMLRYPDAAGLLDNPETYGTYNFYWRSISSATLWNVEKVTSSYNNLSNAKALTSPAQVLPIFFTAGQEPREGYVQPSVSGVQLRADVKDAQKMRIKIAVPNTEKEIAQIGVMVAPSEVVRNMQLKLGISSVAYYAYETPVLYGLVDGKWVNMTTDTDTYFNDVAVPNDSDTYIAFDELGGKPDGIYTVYTLPAADVSKPYKTSEDENTYTVVFGGANGEGIFNDFDDFNTWYTLRPYIKYTDGTVTYGEHEYKSLYYLACYYIQSMLTDYNNAVVGSETIANRYNMDMMYLTTIKDSDGNVLTDAEGNDLYAPASETPSTYSPFAGGGEYSIYHAGRRAEVFRWYAIRTVSRQNNNVILRYNEYDKFDANTKHLISQYEDMFENVWNVVVTAEQNRYVTGVAK